MRRLFVLSAIMIAASMALSGQSIADTANGAPGGSLRQRQPSNVKYIQGTDFAVGTNLTSANVTALVTPVPNGGCNATDFAGFASGTIALIERGGCTFTVKATNAQTAGAVAAIFYNNTSGIITPLVEPSVTIPTAFITQALGQTLAATPSLVLQLVVNTAVKPGKGCGDKNHVHARETECK